MIWLVLLALLALVAALPYLLEAMRVPMNDARRAEAPGSFARLSQGLTHYSWFGPRSDRVLVLVHGLSAPSWIFSGLISGLQMMRFRVLSFDLYGRGYSDRVTGKQDLALFTEQLGELLDELGLRQPVTLMGYSMGGAIATSFAAAEPDRVERLILLAPAGIRYTPAKLATFIRDRGRFGSWLWGLLGGTFVRVASHRAVAEPSAIPDLPERLRGEVRIRGYLPSLLSSERNALAEDLTATHRELAAMYIPTLAIWGEADTVIPVAAMGQLAQWNRQARQEVVPGAGHGLIHTHPKAVIAEIHTFLREMPNV